MTLHDAEVVGIGEADQDLTTAVSNKELSETLKLKADHLVNRWFLPNFREFWKREAPLRETVETKFAGKYGRVPDRPEDWEVLLGEFVLEELNTSPEWIFDHTGIKERRVAREDIATSDLAASAAENALAMAGISPQQVDGIFLATVTPDHLYTPPTTALVAKKLGVAKADQQGNLRHISYLDCAEACSSFMAAFKTACLHLMCGVCKTVLVIGADVMTRTASRFSRNLLPIMGDGAGALVLVACPRNLGSPNFLPSWFFDFVDGELSDLIITPAGGSRMPVTAGMINNPLDQRHTMMMNGPAVRKQAVRLLLPAKGQFKKALGNVLPKALEQAGFSMDNLEDFFRALNSNGLILFHQANGVINADLEERLRREFGYEGKFFGNIAHRANTTSATIPLLLLDAWRKGVLKARMMIFATVFGGGFTAASARFKWTLEQ